MISLHQPRPYQTQAIDWILEQVNRLGKKQILLVAPPGSGKTLIAAHAIFAMRSQKLTLKIAFLVTLSELLKSTLKEFYPLFPSKGSKSTGKSLSIRTVQEISARSRKHNHAPSLENCSFEELHIFYPKLVAFAFSTDVVFVDEAHLGFGFTAVRLLRKINPAIVLVGLTATPLRMDGRSLKNWADSYHSIALLSETISWGGNAPFEYHSVGDFKIDSPFTFSSDGEDLSEVEAKKCWESLDKEQIISQILKDCELGQYPLIVLPRVKFCVELAQMISEIHPNGDRAIAMLTGSTSEEHKGRWADSYNKESTIGLTVRKTATGFNHPPTKSLHLLYPIQSLPFLVQVLGRALRPHKGAIAHLWDWVGASTFHSRFWSFETIDWLEFLESKEWNTVCPNHECRLKVQACHNRRPETCPDCGTELNWEEHSNPYRRSDRSESEETEPMVEDELLDTLQPVISVEFVSSPAWVGAPVPTKEYYQHLLKQAYNARNRDGSRVSPFKANYLYRQRTRSPLTNEERVEWLKGAIFPDPSKEQIDLLHLWCGSVAMSEVEKANFIKRSV